MNCGLPRGGSLTEVTTTPVRVTAFHRAALALLVFSSLLLLSATDPRAAVVVRSFDTGDFPVVEATIDVTDADGQPVCDLTSDGIDVTENGVPVLDLEVETDVGPSGLRRVVLVVSAGLRAAGGSLECSRERAHEILDFLGPGDEVGLVTVRSCATVDVTPTTDHDAVRTALDGLVADGGAALVDGLYLGLQTVCDAGGGQVIALTDGIELDSDVCPVGPDGFADDTLTDDVQELVALGTSCDARLDVLSERDENRGWLRDTVDGLGGRAVVCDDATGDDLQGFLGDGAIQTCRTTVRFTSPSGSGGESDRTVEICVPASAPPRCDTFAYAVAGLFLPADLAGAFEGCRDPSRPITVGVGVSPGEDEVVAARLELTEVDPGDDTLVVDLVADPDATRFRGTVPAGRLGFDTVYEAVFVADTVQGATLRLPPDGAFTLCTLPDEDEAISLAVPRVQTRPGVEVEVPVELRGLRSSFVVSYSLELDLGGAPVTGVVGSHASTVAADAEWGPPAAALTDDGRLFVSGAGASPIATNGVLVVLRLRMGLGGPGGCQPLTFLAATLNEGDPPVAETIDGQICVDTRCVDAVVRTWKATEPVAGVDVRRIDDGTEVTTTDAEGAYSVCVGDDEILEFELVRAADGPFGVSPLDASLVLQSTVGLVPIPDPDAALDTTCDDEPVHPAVWAADTSGDGTVTAFDASLILQRVVGLIDAFPAGAWRFTCSPFEVGGAESVSEHHAVRVGDVNASWTADSTPSVMARESVPRTLRWRCLDHEGRRWALVVEGGDPFHAALVTVDGVPRDASVHTRGSWSSAMRVDGERVRVATAGVRARRAGEDLLVVAATEPWNPRSTSVETDDTVATMMPSDGTGSLSTPRGIGLEVAPTEDGPGVRIRWSLPRSAAGRLQMFDVRGRLVDEMRLDTTVGTTTWNATDSDDRRLARGVYFVRLQADGGSGLVRKIVLLEP